LAGLRSSVTNSTTCSASITRRVPSRCSAAAAGSPKAISVATAVSGNTPVGTTSAPNKALISVDFARLNSPTTDTKKRPAPSRSANRAAATPSERSAATTANSSAVAINSSSSLGIGLPPTPSARGQGQEPSAPPGGFGELHRRSQPR
jgi:hypothetical protein